MDYINIYKSKTPNSQKYFLKAQKLMPGGISHNIRFYEPYPIFIEKALGSKIFDIDGNEYIDLWMGHYANILGHNPPILKETNKEILEKGYHFGCINKDELELAEKIIKFIPSAEKVRFCTSGTEATTYAIRLARAYTQKPIVLKMAGGWHGAGSELAKAIKYPYQESTSGILGKLTDSTKYIFFNNIEKSYSIIKKLKNDIACIILEPVIGEGGFLPATKEYLNFLREETKKIGAILIFDEIITGFRIDIGGAQKYFEILPDLTTLGKIAGGGFNIGIIAGKSEILELSSVDYSGKNKVIIGGGTFSATPYSMRAGKTVLNFLENNQKIYFELEKKGNYVRNKLNEYIKNNNINALVTGIGSLYMVHFPLKKITIKSPEDIGSQTDIYKRENEFKVRLLNKGIHVMHGGGAISTAHSYEDLDKIIDKTCEVFEEIKNS